MGQHPSHEQHVKTRNPSAQDVVLRTMLVRTIFADLQKASQSTVASANRPGATMREAKTNGGLRLQELPELIEEFKFAHRACSCTQDSLVFLDNVLPVPILAQSPRIQWRFSKGSNAALRLQFKIDQSDMLVV